MGAGTDNVKGGSGADTIKVNSAGHGNADTIDGGAGSSDILQLSAGSHSFTDNNKLLGIETVKGHASYATIVDLTGQVENLKIDGGSAGDTISGGNGNDIITGGGGTDIIAGGAGDDSLTGNADNDTFKVDGGTDTITDLTSGDILIVSNSAKAQATGITLFVATADTKIISGSAEFTAASGGGEINLSSAHGASNNYTIIGGDGVDTLTGDCLLYTSPSPRD